MNHINLPVEQGRLPKEDELVSGDQLVKYILVSLEENNLHPAAFILYDNAQVLYVYQVAAGHAGLDLDPGQVRMDIRYQSVFAAVYIAERIKVQQVRNGLNAQLLLQE